MNVIELNRYYCGVGGYAYEYSNHGGVSCHDFNKKEKRQRVHVQ